MKDLGNSHYWQDEKESLQDKTLGRLGFNKNPATTTAVTKVSHVALKLILNLVDFVLIKIIARR